jgi:MoxR-like ATPase
VSEKVTENSDYFRERVWYIINTIQANQLFVHSSVLTIKYGVKITPKKATKRKTSKPKMKVETKHLPEILTICVLNALVPNSAMLLVGGHGGGKTSIVKYLGRMFTGKSLGDIEEAIVRAHPQLTEEKLIATLKISKLMQGEEQVIWRTFARAFWKIVDEVNRMNPFAQNILLSLLAEGKIKYYDAVLNVSKYSLYATLNPHDVGTFEMSAPFLDRFGISIPISMPKSQDLAIILESQDEKLGGYDELVQVPQVLTEEQLLNIWYEVDNVPCSQEAQDFIHAIVREYTLCVRIDKGNSNYLKPSSGLCTGCHYLVPEKVPCCNSDSILSVRVAKDLLRFSRALTWMLGLPEVTINIVSAIAPYVISHRVVYVERYLNKAPYWGDRYAYTKHMLDLIQKRYQTRAKGYEILNKIREGKGTSANLASLRLLAKNDLIVSQDLLPLAETLGTTLYQEKIQEITDAIQLKNIEKITRIRGDLLQNIDFPNRGELIMRLNKNLQILTLIHYNCTLELWNSIRITIDGLIPQFTQKLKETTEQRGTYRLRTEDLDIEINVTGTEPKDIVNFSFYGGPSAQQLKEEIEKYHRKSFQTMDELIQQSKEAQSEIVKGPPISSIAEKQKAQKSKGELDEKTFEEEFFAN